MASGTEPFFVKVAGLAEAVGVSHINQLPGCWHHDVDELWSIDVNGHREPVETERREGSMACAVPPFSAAIFFNGWLAGIIGVGGGIVAAGTLANETTLIAALDDAIMRAK